MKGKPFVVDPGVQIKQSKHISQVGICYFNFLWKSGLTTPFQEIIFLPGVKVVFLYSHSLFQLRVLCLAQRESVIDFLNHWCMPANQHKLGEKIEYGAPLAIDG